MSDRTPQTDANGFIVKDDVLDVGVAMRPAPAGWMHQGPEDALDPNPTRGDYASKRLTLVHWRRGRLNAFGEFVPESRG